MSAINTDLLRNRLGTSHPAVTKADFIKTYAVYNSIATTVPVIQPPSLNMSSVADTGVGIATFNFTAGFSGTFTAVSGSYTWFAFGVTVAPAGRAWVLSSYDTNKAPQDTPYGGIIVTGTLA